MLANLVKRFLHPLRSTGSAKPNFTAHPGIEALESRSLMDASAFVRGLYANVLERAPSDAEVSGWVTQIQNGESLQAVSAAFVGSQEHMALVVSSDYTTLLGRSADQQGVNYWTQQMANGMSQDQVEASIASSEEFLQKHGSTNTDFIQGLYETVLNRSADSAELAYWNQQLDFRTDGQTTHLDVSDRIVGSDEAHRQGVDAIYSQLLNRSPDAGGASYWANLLDNGGSQSEAIEGVVNSPEYLSAYGVATAQ